MMVTSSATRRGFTLVELLVVIAIIGVLIAHLRPAVLAERDSIECGDYSIPDPC